MLVDLFQSEPPFICFTNLLVSRLFMILIHLYLQYYSNEIERTLIDISVDKSTLYKRNHNTFTDSEFKFFLQHLSKKYILEIFGKVIVMKAQAGFITHDSWLNYWFIANAQTNCATLLFILGKKTLIKFYSIFFLISLGCTWQLVGVPPHLNTFLHVDILIRLPNQHAYLAYSCVWLPSLLHNFPLCFVIQRLPCFCSSYPAFSTFDQSFKLFPFSKNLSFSGLISPSFKFFHLCI